MGFDFSYLHDHHKSVFVVVSGVATGIGIAPLLRGYGYEVVHIESNLQRRLGHIHIENDYMECFNEGGNINKLIKKLQKNWNIRAVIPGSEAGVDLAEKLNDKLKIKIGNDPKLAYTRRNKYNAQEFLKKCSISSINQCLISDLKDVYKWIHNQEIQYPIVLKPVESAGTDNVFICYNENEMKKAFLKIKSSKNIFQDYNKKVLCQEYIDGQEYMVNTISWKGEHRIIEMFKINKKLVNNKPLYDVLRLVHPNAMDYKLINFYLKNVYKALGIKFGAVHAEVKVRTKNNKRYVTLIEIAVRLGGVASPAALQDVQSQSQISALVQSYINSGYFYSLPKEGVIPKNNLAAVFFITEHEGTLKKNLDLSLFKKLKSYYSLRFGCKKGDYLHKTRDLLSSPGYIYLVGNKREIENDIKAIRFLEKELYTQLLKTD